MLWKEADGRKAGDITNSLLDTGRRYARTIHGIQAQHHKAGKELPRAVVATTKSHGGMG